MGTVIRAGMMYLLVLAGMAVPAAAQSSPRSTVDGVYSAAQADRGEEVFVGVCGNCHSTTEFKGDDFDLAWSGRTLRDLFRLIRNTMPNDDPGGLSPQQYIDVVAYLLALNELPTGEEDLADDESLLRRIRIEKPGSAR